MYSKLEPQVTLRNIIAKHSRPRSAIPLPGLVNAVLEDMDLFSRLLLVFQDSLLAYVTVLPANSGGGRPSWSGPSQRQSSWEGL